MRLAVMQPYFFPYIGYWQLIRAADRFVILDDVNYIKAGWINRNRLLINGQPTWLTAPVQDASQNRKICATQLQATDDWRDKTVRMVAMAYRRAPCFAEVFPVVEQVLRHGAGNLADYLAHQLRTLTAFMGIDTSFVTTSRRYGNEQLAGQARIVDICRREDARQYLNLPGGRALYDPAAFAAAGVELHFLTMRPLPYPQRSPGFTPFLSIIDALMELGPAGIGRHLDAFDLDTKEQPP